MEIINALKSKNNNYLCLTDVRPESGDYVNWHLNAAFWVSSEGEFLRFSDESEFDYLLDKLDFVDAPSTDIEIEIVQEERLDKDDYVMIAKDNYLTAKKAGEIIEEYYLGTHKDYGFLNPIYTY